MTDIVFLDLETTGLDPQRHTITEMGPIDPDGREREIWISLNATELRDADAIALQINHYYERRQYHSSFQRQLGDASRAHQVVSNTPEHRVTWAVALTAQLDGVILAGNNVKFDQAFLEAWLRRHGACPTWDYHVLDVPTYAAAVLNERRKDIIRQHKRGEKAPYEAFAPPFKSRAISAALHITEPEGDEAHTALADARWSKTIWKACR